MQTFKKCSKCLFVKPASAFYKNHSKRDIRAREDVCPSCLARHEGLELLAKQ